MTTRAVEQVDDWDTRPFSGGYAGLHDLAADGFSGIVTAGPTRLCMTKGTVVGVLDGTIEDFEGASGTAHEAPSPALPLLAAMQEGDTEVQGQYYTEDTPLAEVDRTLSDGTFTGYIELAENVLSGDYYQVYHQGRSMSVAFVGASGQLLTEDEAFEKAEGEVGIYEVHEADVSVVEVPEVDDAAAGAAATGESGASSEPATDEDPAEPAPDESGDAAAGSPPAEAAGSGPEAAATEPEQSADATVAEDDAGSRAEATADTDTAERESETGTTEAESGTETDGPDPDARRSERTGTRSPEADADTSTDRAGTGGAAAREEGERRRESNETRRSGSEPTDRREETPAREARSTADRNGGSGDDRRSRGAGSQRGTGRSQSAGNREAGRSTTGTQRRPQPQAAGGENVGDLETRSIPSLDPDRTTERDGTGSGAAAASAGPEPQPDPQPAPEPEPGPRGTSPSSRGSGNGPTTGTPPEEAGSQPREGSASHPPGDQPSEEPRSVEGGGADPAEIERLEAELDDAEDELADLRSELETVTEERDDLEATLETVREERDELQSRVEELERRIDDLRTEGGGESVADRERLGPGEAIDGTNLFIRYASKGEATLEAAHGGRAEASAVNDNLEIQHHTQFESDDVAVNGQPFDEYLTGTIQYQFVEWVVRVLPYEIRDTGHEGALKDLYDALPNVDRAELNGTISVQFQQDGEQHRSQETFDIVLRDRMGNPLAVANLNDSRDPATQGMMEDLITASERVGESKGSLAGSFLVTSSFFQPEAMEAASDATGGGLLSRDKRESFVKLSRKDGFHLCLVEARGEKFNLSVPEI